MHAYGGGCEIAISTDFNRSDDAVFGHPKRSSGCRPAAGRRSFFRVSCPRKGHADAETGDPITAQEAYRLGMVNELIRAPS